MIELIENGRDWDLILEGIGTYDFYHTHGYHRVLAKDGEIPVMVHYLDKEVEIAFPFIMRKINGTYRDLTSVHGYLGPVGRGIGPGFDPELFRKEFENLLVGEKIVSIFSKLNPFLPHQDRILDAMGTITPIGELIYFDQTMDEETQRSHYNRNTRQNLKKLRRLARVEEAQGPRDIECFIDIYHRTMDRLDAAKTFYYGQDYFRTLMESKLLDTKLWFAIHNDTEDVMAAAFATHTGSVCHLELMGTNEAYFNLAPSRILYDHARETLRGSGIKYLVLGGGSGGREGSLMRFKATFTQNYTDFQVWKYIAMPEVYENLVTDGQRVMESDFFPRYRLTAP